MSFVVASQFDPAFNARLRALPIGLTVIDAPADAPWDVADRADVLLVVPSPIWRTPAARGRPAVWPGRLGWVFTASVGVDPYPDWLLDAPLVSCGRGVASEEIADYAISAVFHRAKDLQSVRARAPEDWTPRPLGRIGGTTMGLIGLGAIGSAVARRALALGMRVVSARRRALPSPVEGVELLGDIAQVVASADHLLLALPATEATRRLVDARLLAHARPTAHLINISRGSIIDQDALLDALDTGRLAYATLDVTDPEPLPPGHRLWTHPGVMLTPHLSSNYMILRDALFEKVCTDLQIFAAGDPPPDIVDPREGY
jgi:phosphoglycerate dehydrogenase-like enzyme